MFKSCKTSNYKVSEDVKPYVSSDYIHVWYISPHDNKTINFSTHQKEMNLI